METLIVDVIERFSYEQKQMAIPMQIESVILRPPNNSLVVIKNILHQTTKRGEKENVSKYFKLPHKSFKAKQSRNSTIFIRIFAIFWFKN